MPNKSSKTKLKTIRMPNEVADWLDKENGRLVLTSLFDLVSRGKIYCDIGGRLSIARIASSGNLVDSRELDRLKIEISGLRDEIVARDERIAELSHGNEFSELESMANAVGLSLNGLLDDLTYKLSNGSVSLSPSGLSFGVVDECPFNWRTVVEACDEMSVDYDDAVKKFVSLIYRG